METSAAEQMKELVQKLNEAAKAYYQEDREIMSNREYDAAVRSTGKHGKGNRNRSGRTAQLLMWGMRQWMYCQRKRHESPMLSLDKTKDRDDFKSVYWDTSNSAFLEDGRAYDRSDI